MVFDEAKVLEEGRRSDAIFRAVFTGFSSGPSNAAKGGIRRD
jgi:hypothetical protein